MKKIFIIVALITIVCQVSCSKFLDIDRPVNQLTSGAVFSDSTSIEAAVAGMYASLMDNYINTFNGRISISMGLLADELEVVSTNGNFEFAINAVLPEDPTNFSIWSDAYKLVYHCNTLIVHLKNTQAISEDSKLPYLAEAMFFRGLAFSYLGSIYGAVPLMTSTDFNVNSRLPRTELKLVFDQAWKDVSESLEYFKKSGKPTNRFRSGKWACYALLSRLALWKGDWDAAILNSSEVIGSGEFTLPELDDVFKISSHETILQLMPSVSLPFNSGEGYSFIPFSSGVTPTYFLTEHLVESFEVDDQRKARWLGEQTVGGMEYYYPYKYKVSQGSDYKVKEECQVVLRLGEQYLIRAEAYAHLNRNTESVADLDSLRRRAGLPLYSLTNPGVSGQELLDAVFHERRTELFAEWGHRWFDLIRSGKANSVLGIINTKDWQSTDTLLPIPQKERLANTNLSQNDGY